MKHIVLLISLFTFIIGNKIAAQSLSGNVNSSFESNNLAYANVEIYNNDKLIASLITDKNGDYNVALDSGEYVINVMYNEYKTITKNISVTGNELYNSSLKNDPQTKVIAEIVVVSEKNRISRKPKKAKSHFGLSDMKSSEPKEEHSLVDPIIEEYKIDSETEYSYETPLIDCEIITKSRKDNLQTQAYLKGITAAEINDFSKWNLWEDLIEGELAVYQKNWNFSPQKRYVVQLINQNKIPVVDAIVKLEDKDENIIWASRTDNTGKAELWSTIEYSNEEVKGGKITIEYQGDVKEIKRPKEFQKGINFLALNTNCETYNAVDIAFVVDATGSIQDEIDYLKLEINDIIYQAKQMNNQLTMRFGSVFYRDHGDSYLTKHQDFTKVLSRSTDFIKGQRADGGGDTPEAVEDALEVAIDSLTWSKNARTRILFLVLDAPPHNNTAIKTKLKSLSKKAAKKGIRIVPITASGINKTAEYLLRSIALSTNGTYLFITDDSGIGGSHIKPSTDNYEVKLLNDLLKNLIKNYIYVPQCEETIPEPDLEYLDSLVTYTNPEDTIDSTETNTPLINTIEWNFYPNPTYGELTIEVSENVEKLYLTDLSGKTLRQISMNEFKKTKINLEGLPVGIYLLRYPIGKQWLSGKVILMR